MTGNRRNVVITVLIALAAVALIVAVAVLYPRLAGNNEPDNLGPVQNTTSVRSTTTAPGESDGTAEQTEANYDAPDFSLSNNLGSTHALSDFADKTVVLNFWASWCPPCKEEMPDFEQVFKETGSNSPDSEVIFMMINATFGQETKEAADDYYQNNDFTFPYYYDFDTTVSQLYFVQAFPTTVIITSEGEIFNYRPGMIPDADALRDMITAAQTYTATGQLPG